MKITSKIILLVLSFLIISSSIIITSRSISSTTIQSITLDNSYILDSNITKGVISFLRNNQDVSSWKIDIMDQAYYLGNIIVDIKKIDPNTYSDALSSLENAVFDFIQKSRNENGGYANWKNGVSSMESTFQAIEIYNIFNRMDELTTFELNKTKSFVDSLQTVDFGFFPLSNWDAPDITSTYRAVSLANKISLFTGINYNYNDSIIDYVRGNFLPPIFLNTPSGYSEIKGGKVELLATYYSMEIQNFYNEIDPEREKIAAYLNLLTDPSGGVAGIENGIPTTGFTASGIKLFNILTDGLYNMSASLNPNFIDNAKNFILSNKQAGTGFSSSGRDTTPSLSSTFFALNIITDLIEKGKIISHGFEITDIIRYIVDGDQSTFGFGNYPGDIPDLSYTTRSLLLAKLIGNTSWIRDGVSNYIGSTYDKINNGFGYRPESGATVKYTYYGIRGMRAFNISLEAAGGIKNYLLSSQNPDGLFGKKPNYQLSYLTYSYWALRSLELLGFLNEDELNFSQIIDQLRFYRNIDLGYTNFPGSESSIISTFRALKIIKMLGGELDPSESFEFNFGFYRHESGGFLDRVTKTIPSMEATYYAIQIANMMEIEYNKTETLDFILSLRNQDGGFALKPGSSSRLSSTFLAISLLYQFAGSEVINEEDIIDYFSPIIYPTFNDKLDSNSTIAGSYTTSAIIRDPESGVQASWVEVEFTDNTGIIEEFIFEGQRKGDDPNRWVYTLGPFNQGVINFRIVAEDGMENYSYTQWFMLNSLGFNPGGGQSTVDYVEIIMSLIPYFAFTISGLDVYKTFRKSKGGVIKMQIKENQTKPHQSLNILYLVILMSIISALARLFIGDVILILQASIFLFKFLFAVLAILFMRYVIGMNSYGYFGPSIIAVSWLNIGPLWGLFLYVNMLLISILVRKLIHPYGLPVGFRIGINMVFLITSLSLLELFGELFKIDFLAGSLLIPILITPWMSDRYVNDSEETNQLDAFYKLINTIVIIAVAYLAMSFTSGILFFVLHPEIWVVLILFLLYIGRGRYYTRFDKKRFDRFFKKEITPLTLLSRNRDYISKYNQKVLFPFINKFRMKEQFDKWRVPTTNLFAVIQDETDLPLVMNRLTTEDIYEDGFVIKPSESYGGKGIVVVTKRVEDNFVISGEKYHMNALQEHIVNILQGEYLTSQTGNSNDIAIIEERIVTDKGLGSISTGLADVRVIVFQGIPIMAMARLPTSYSDGKANLKQGAIGAGIDMKTGKIYHSEYKKHKVTIHPDTGEQIEGYQFKNWKEILAVSTLAQKSTNLGYAGVDLVIDNKGRVLVLEINKRPGLEIQNINLSSLLDRIKYVENNNLNAENFSPIRSATIGMEIAENWEVLS